MNRRRPSIAARLALPCALLALTIAGCSMQRLAYNQADWLVLRQMDSYLDLGDAQRERVALALATAHQRHRREQLPIAAASLTSASNRARQGLSEEDARWFLEQARMLLADTLETILPTLAQALANLSPEQRQHLAQRLEERNDDYVSTHALDASREERLERRARRTVERIEDWTGPLSEEQVELVHTLRNAMPDSAAEWLAYTRDRQQALLALIDANAPATEIEALLREWWSLGEALPQPLAAHRVARIEASLRLVARLDATLDSMQRAHLVDRIDGLARDARELAQET